MRILIIHTLYEVAGGEDSVVTNETELLRSGGFEIENLYFNNAGGSLLKLLQLPFNYGSYRKTLVKIQEFKPDVIHIHNFHFAASPAVFYAARKHKVPVVMTLHNYRLLCPSATLFLKGEIFTASLNQTFPHTAVSRKVYRDSQLLTFWLAATSALHTRLKSWAIPARYIALGAHSREIFRGSKLNYLTDRMVIKPNFCYPPSFTVVQSPGEYYLYTGRLSPEKGIQGMLEAFSKNNLPLTIIGSGPLEAEVRAWSGKYSNIRFLGPQPKQAVYEAMAKAKALIFPSIWYETFGMVIIEAFSCGTPVIAADMGQMKHLIRDKQNGLLYNASDKSSLANAILQFEKLTTEEQMTHKQNAVLTYQELYTPETNLAQLKELYRSVLENPIN